ncbi:MAG: phosphatidate cytidylyltransferase [Treponema sp.]|nr:phosphatidate cytidylyltransferase [Treponema sp.]
MKSEIIRKLLHFLVALSVLLASVHLVFTLILLLAGTVIYTIFEILRLHGIRIPVISALTSFASRPHEKDRFVLGPVTLGAGAFCSLLIFPPIPAAIAVFALAFGDGLASLAGKAFGRLRPRFLFGKSIEGSFVCFAVVCICSYLVSGNIAVAFFSALTAMLVESLPLGDFDNLLMPLAAGLAVQLTLAL